MSIPVSPTELPETLTSYGPGILIPTPDRDFPRIHEVLARAVIIDAPPRPAPASSARPDPSTGTAEPRARLEIPGSMAGPALRRLAGTHPDPHCTVVFSPTDPHGWVLVIDGLAHAEPAAATGGESAARTWALGGERIDVGKQDTVLVLDVASAMLHRAGELKPS